MWNNVTRFLLPGFKFKNNDVETIDYLYKIGFKNAYLCKQPNLKYDIYLVFHPKKIVLDLINFSYSLRTRVGYKTTLFLDDKIIFIIEYPEHLIENVYKPFVQNKIYTIDNTYKEKYFVKHFLYKGVLENNASWAMLHKDDYTFDITQEIYHER